MKQYLEIGKIVSTHGIKGEVKVQPWCDSPEFLCEFDDFYINNGSKKIIIDSAKTIKNMAILKIEGIDTPEQAVLLRNQILFINRDDVSLDEGCYFIQDLIGMDVIDNDTGKCYGKLSDVTETGANDVYHIKTESGKMLYVPAIPDVVIKTDVAEQAMYIRPLKGLFEDED